ncbi:hypothetical protein YWIDRAFT_03944 [Streptomyces sp. SceaMP-e96]|uniref:hypothetical protein n=1 Tax=unclassified Streptomyces TaxID=2593676 RepID=UPI000823EFD6|nr:MULTISPECIES: hypothetical protein [unclassified Streptomyces]MYT14536.1 hypothetical protein [Streptomyces sp. SID4951]SCK60100.1 hypothetical protein YWIDRAFT_03944 [Streptomyces sp. SceaMP-e96]
MARGLSHFRTHSQQRSKEGLAEGQKAKANRLAKDAPNIDKSLSVLVAEAVAKVVPYAAEVIPSFLRPAEAPENLAAGPIVVITQDGKAAEKGGILTAGITIRSFRLPHFQQIDKRDMVREFDARGWNMRFEPTQSTDRQDGFIVDVIRGAAVPGADRVLGGSTARVIAPGRL